MRSHSQEMPLEIPVILLLGISNAVLGEIRIQGFQISTFLCGYAPKELDSVVCLESIIWMIFFIGKMVTKSPK